MEGHKFTGTTFDMSSVRQLSNLPRPPPAARKSSLTYGSSPYDNFNYDMGLEAQPNNNNPNLNAHLDTFEVLLSVGGMSCTSCTGKIEEILKTLSYVSKVQVNLMSNSCTVEFMSVGDGRSDATKIMEQIEEIGFEASISHVKNLTSPVQVPPEALERRQISLNIGGMDEYSSAAIVSLLGNTFSNLVIIAEPTISKPILTISYIPCLPKITIRKIVDCIQSINPAWNIVPHHPPSEEEQSMQVLNNELKRYSRYFLACTIFFVPAFVLGVIFMSLVKESNPIRMKLEEPTWVGSVSGFEWALFIVSTPVMFGCAFPFHKHALKDIYSNWRRGSKVPMRTRLFKFGSMHLLVSLAVTIAYGSSLAMVIAKSLSDIQEEHIISYFEAAVVLTWALLLGRWIDVYVKKKTTDDLNAIARLRPKEAILMELQNNSNIATSSERSLALEVGGINSDYTDNRGVIFRRIPADFLEIGDIVSIAQGSTPPTDCIMISPYSIFNETTLSGEDKPILREVGSEIFSGTINLGQAVTGRVNKLAGDCYVDKIMDTVREARRNPAPIERISEKVTAYFVPGACAIAVLTWMVWMILGKSGVLPRRYLETEKGGWEFFSTKFSIAIFVVACPCGIGLAAPTAIYVAISVAARYGILPKGGGVAFEAASRISHMFFDKTGTLTEGVEPKITDEMILFPDENSSKIIFLAARLLEETSSHPLGRSMVNHCSNKPNAQGTSLNVTEVVGKGIKGSIEVDGVVYNVLIGNERFLLEHDTLGVNEQTGTLLEWKKDGKSVILLALSSTDKSCVFGTHYSLAAMFATTDPIRPEALYTIKELESVGINCHMITGDNEITAKAVGSKLGFKPENIIFSVLPNEKARIISDLQSRLQPRPIDRFSRFLRRFYCPSSDDTRPIICMVGDGLNDGPALAVADVGISVGSGTDLAKQTAKFVLVNSDLTSLLTLVELSRAVVRRIKINFVWACIFNLIMVPMAGGWFYWAGQVRLDAKWGAIAMMCSSFSVLGSSWLLSRTWPLVGFRPRKMKQW